MRRLLAQERGSAVLAAVAVLALGLTLGSVAAHRALVVTDGANRDTNAKRSLQAADAGLQAAVDRMNRLDAAGVQGPCVARNSSTGALSVTSQDPAVPGWCPEVTEQLADGTVYRYRVSIAQEVYGAQVTSERRVVATGASGAVERRVAAEVTALTGTPLFHDSTVISLLDLNMPNQTSVLGNVRSNGDVLLYNSAQICGHATPGPGRAVNDPAKVCAGYTTTPADQELVLNPVDQGTVATDNDNEYICAPPPDGDPCTSRTKIEWDHANDPRRLVLNNNATVTLGKSVYSFCSLELNQNSSLIIPRKSDNSAVQIYIDAPENCPPGSTGFVKGNGAEIVNLNPDPVSLQIYVVGSDTQPTTITLANNNVMSPAVPMVIYAPKSTVNIANHAHIYGAVAAKQVNMDNNVTVERADSVASLTSEAIMPLYRQQQYRECSPRPAAGAAPDGGC